MFLKGLACGLLATAGNFALLYWATRGMLRKQSRAAQFLIPLTYLARYAVLGGVIFLFLRFRFGSIWGLLTGVTIGIAGFLIWQVIVAHTRRSDNLPS